MGVGGESLSLPSSVALPKCGATVGKSHSVRGDEIRFDERNAETER